MRSFTKILSLFFLSLLVSSCALTKKYPEQDRMWAYPEIQAFEQQDAKVAYPDNALLFIGSSSIRLWKTLEQDMAPYPVIQ